MKKENTEEEIIERTNELQKVLIAFTKIDEQEKNVQLEKARLHKQLSLVKDEIRNLTQTI